MHRWQSLKAPTKHSIKWATLRQPSNVAHPQLARRAPCCLWRWLTNTVITFPSRSDISMATVNVSAQGHPPGRWFALYLLCFSIEMAELRCKMPHISTANCNVTFWCKNQARGSRQIDSIVGAKTEFAAEVGSIVDTVACSNAVDECCNEIGAVRMRHSIREIATQLVILWILLHGRQTQMAASIELWIHW